PVRIRAWLAAMNTSEGAGLIGRVDTQVLLGDRVRVIGLTSTWAHVVVPGQATPLDKRGYPVWIPRRQLSPVPPAAPAGASVATITSRTAWLEDARGTRLAEASYGTSAPILAQTPRMIEVALPAGRTAWLLRDAVAVHPAGNPALPATIAATIRDARRFVGLPYVWGGTSGFGVDCSGLVYLVFRAHGVTLPRDAEPQSLAGRSVAVGSQQPGDLVFFERAAVVHHVAIWLGGGMILEAPSVGTFVRVATLSALPYAHELSIARRVLL
ncbi:MAG TPA: C40 family peptidase, partial [Candidatus Limnocylindrales bacterium]|nr:C40 family peptidase [Candidatus Limnocylindrales bacterium]